MGKERDKKGKKGEEEKRKKKGKGERKKGKRGEWISGNFPSYLSIKNPKEFSFLEMLWFPVAN